MPARDLLHVWHAHHVLAIAAVSVMLVACGSSDETTAAGTGSSGSGTPSGSGATSATASGSTSTSGAGGGTASGTGGGSATSGTGGVGGTGNVVPAASCSSADVQSAIDAAMTGDTVTLPAPCRVTWDEDVNVPAAKGITVNGAGATVHGHIHLEQGAATSRITGFGFTEAFAVHTSGDKGSAPFRLDHNTFTFDAGGVTFVETSGNAPGLIDNNGFNAPDNAEMIHNMGMGASDDSGWSDDIVPGSADAVYVEDNTFTNTGATGNPAYFWGSSSIQSYYGARSVIRHNTMKMSQIDQHGTPGMIGARWWEIYENTFDTGVPNASQCCFITLRGGSGVVFDNHRVGANQGGGGVDMYEEDTGYPALYQVGRGKDQASDPAYVWGNDAELSVGSQTPQMVAANRDYYESQKPGYSPYAYPHPLQGK